MVQQWHNCRLLWSKRTRHRLMIHIAPFYIFRTFPLFFFNGYIIYNITWCLVLYEQIVIHLDFQPYQTEIRSWYSYTVEIYFENSRHASEVASENPYNRLFKQASKILIIIFGFISLNSTHIENISHPSLFRQDFSKNSSSKGGYISSTTTLFRLF